MAFPCMFNVHRFGVPKNNIGFKVLKELLDKSKLSSVYSPLNVLGWKVVKPLAPSFKVRRSARPANVMLSILDREFLDRSMCLNSVLSEKVSCGI